MKNLFLISMIVAGALAGCAVQDPDDNASSPDELDVAAQPDNAARVSMSCDDFDSYCGEDRPCGKGFVCAFDPNNCGSNFFGVYPSCGVTATCYPACQPE